MKTPYEAWTNKKPTVSHLRIFCSRAIVLNKKQNKKFIAKGEDYTMIGYSSTAKAYRLYNPETRKIIESRDIIFLEDELVRKPYHKSDVEPCVEKSVLDLADVLIENEHASQNIDSVSTEEEDISEEEDEEKKSNETNSENNFKSRKMKIPKLM